MEMEGGRRFYNYRNTLLTKYIKVNDKKAIQVEIQRSASDSSLKKTSAKRVERKHLKEIESLLKDVIIHQIENEDRKSKKHLTECKILTGEIVRLGYTFKKKPENQILLLSDESDEDEFYARSLKIYSEKLVVFYYPLDQEDSPGSNTAMSQMVRALNSGNLSQSQTGTVSISSYFQKSTSSTSKNKTESSTGKTKTTGSMDDKCEESEETEAGDQSESSHHDEEKHRAIKNMIKRSAPALSRRTKHRKVMATNSRLQDAYNFEDSSDSTKHRKTCKSSMVKDNGFDGSGLSLDSILTSEDGDLHPCQEKGSPSKILADSAARDCARMDLDFSSSRSSSEQSLVNCERNDRTESTLSVKSTKTLDSCVVSVNSDDSSCAVDSGFFKQNVCRSNRGEVDFSESANSSSNAYIQKTEVSLGYNVKFGGEKSENDSLSMTRPGSDSDLPDFSFLKRKTRASCLNQVEEKDYEELQKNQDQFDIVIQGLEIGPARLSAGEVTRSQKRPFSTMSASDEDSLPKDQDEKRLKLKRPRVKQILPEISDYQLEISQFQKSAHKNSLKDIQANDLDPLPELSSRNRRNDKSEKTSSKEIPVNDLDPLPVLSSSRNRKNEKGNKCIETDSVNIDPVTSDCRKIELFKRPQNKSVEKNKEPRVFSFKKASSSNKVKRQSILNFLSLSEQEELSGDTAGVEEDFRDSDSLESVIIDGLDDLKEPKFKDGESEAIEVEINSLGKVDELNEQHLHYLLMKHKVYLQDIFSGKVSSERHDVYKKGGKARKDLNHHVHLGLFTEEQLDVVMETLMSIFCKKHHKYLEYIMKVLLPEALIKIYMNFHKMSHKEAEDDMLEAVRTPGGIHI